jgi:hypothetical protein
MNRPPLALAPEHRSFTGIGSAQVADALHQHG